MNEDSRDYATSSHCFASSLRAEELTLENVVRVTSYVQDPADLAQYNQLYREFFSQPFPARTTITSCLTAALKFEIDVIAVRPN